ncbi:MAG: hypothetical protein HFJ29_08115, partial [Clostridia bacterium]|nr:hypothetical protein [Clostridia bacterium]
MGDNSIFKLAQDAKDKTEQAKNDERDYFNNLDNTINQYIDGNSGESNPSSKVDVSTITDKVDKNTPAEDSLGNPITIPEGFKVVPDGQDGVEYTYTGDKKPTVQDGIVIADDENNQFVWIPVGSIKNKDNTTTTIQLARYTFDITINPDSYEISGGTGAIKITKTDGTGLTDEWVELNGGGYEYLEEVSTSTTYGNTKAKNIEEFKIKAKANGGYYLARFEASKGIDNKVKSKSAAVWNNITQPEVATKAREMYTSTNFESDLVNSYAWDTAIVFIQTYSGDNDYSKQNSKNTSLANTGVNNDKVCNIYDMASNTAEWTTETSTVAGYPCTYRGGNYGNSNFYTAGRDSNVTSGSSGRISFRPLLYAK